jgi:hypothetical protein
MLNRAGLRQVDSAVVELITEKFGGDAVFDNNYFLQKDSSSQLILLSEQAYRAGLARIRNAITEARARGEEIVFASEIKIWLCYGFKPN